MKNILHKREYKSRDLLLLMCRVSPLYASVAIVYRLISAACPTLTIFATAGFIDAALAVQAGKSGLNAIFLQSASCWELCCFRPL